MTSVQRLTSKANKKDIDSPDEQTPLTNTEDDLLAEAMTTINRTNITRSSELKLNPPTAFTGKRSELDSFLQDVTLHLAVNEDVYNTDNKRIAYALSFMKESDAKS